MSSQVDAPMGPDRAPPLVWAWRETGGFVSRLALRRFPGNGKSGTTWIADGRVRGLACAGVCGLGTFRTIASPGGISIHAVVQASAKPRSLGGQTFDGDAIPTAAPG